MCHLRACEHGTRPGVPKKTVTREFPKIRGIYKETYVQGNTPKSVRAAGNTLWTKTQYSGADGQVEHIGKNEEKPVGARKTHTYTHTEHTLT